MLKCKTRSFRHWTAQRHCGYTFVTAVCFLRTFSTWKRSRGILLVVPWSSKGIAKCLSRGACQGENWKKLYFSPHCGDEITTYYKQNLWKKPFWMISEGLLLISIGLFYETYAFSVMFWKIHFEFQIPERRLSLQKWMSLFCLCRSGSDSLLEQDRGTAGNPPPSEPRPSSALTKYEGREAALLGCVINYI